MLDSIYCDHFEFNFITEFNPAHEIIWSTYFGGSNLEYTRDICIDNHNDLIIVGETNSDDFPVIPYGNAYYQDTLNEPNQQDAFIVKFHNHIPVWSTYIGGVGDDIATAISTDIFGNYYIVGQTDSNNFPIYKNYNPNAFIDSTYNEGGDAFLAKFNNQGEEKLISYFGGSDSDYFSDIFINTDGSIFISGYSRSNDIPFATPNMLNAYIQDENKTYFAPLDRYNNTGILVSFTNNLQYQWLTYFGGTNAEYINSLTITNNNTLFIVGSTGSSNEFPLKQSEEDVNAYYQDSLTWNEGFITKFDLSLFVDIKEIITNDNKLLIYPNPAKKLISINSEEKILAYEIYDISGKQIKTGVYKNYIVINDLTQGVYILKAKTEKNIFAIKFIKK